MRAREGRLKFDRGLVVVAAAGRFRVTDEGEAPPAAWWSLRLGASSDTFDLEVLRGLVHDPACRVFVWRYEAFLNASGRSPPSSSTSAAAPQASEPAPEFIADLRRQPRATRGGGGPRPGAAAASDAAGARLCCGRGRSSCGATGAAYYTAADR